MRILRNLFVLAFSATMSFATAAYATTVTGNIISLGYETVSTVKKPFSSGGFLTVNDSATLAIFVSEGRTELDNGAVNTVTDANGWIRVYNSSGSMIELGGGGVQIEIKDGLVSFATLVQGDSNPNTTTWMALNDNVNTINVSTSVFATETGREFDSMLTALAGGDADGGEALQIKRRKGGNKTGSNNRLVTDAGPISVNVSTVPLPAGAWLLLGGVGIMALRRKRAA